MSSFRITLLTCGVALALAAAPASASEPGWNDWDAGLAQARATGKPLLVDVYTDWCGWCKRMDRDVYSREDVRDLLAKHFVLVRLDAESAAAARYLKEATTPREIAARFGVTGYPTTIFLKSTGDHIVNVPGYVPADRFKLILRYVGEDYIGRGVSWAEFSRQAGAPRR